MNSEPSTVTIEHIEQRNCICMKWDRHVNALDVDTAFSEITKILYQSPIPMYVIVDLRRDPNFPIGVTLKGAFFGPYRDSKLEEWLIISSNPAARVIERTLASVTGRHNVHWFDTEDEAMAYLESALYQGINS